MRTPGGRGRCGGRRETRLRSRWEVSRCPSLVGLNREAGSSSCPFGQTCLQSCYCFPQCTRGCIPLRRLFSAGGQTIKLKKLPAASSRACIPETAGTRCGQRLVPSQLEQPSAEIKPFVCGT
ncbi:unnamed protein product [Rangifer tarandus platyrhynchus]|uniref:Uncharacterized protein n=1 Tax=Rangifer tarandus platyrhynchus TaxID=3082113 RepID=A0AC59ZJA6_RANTA